MDKAKKELEKEARKIAEEVLEEARRLNVKAFTGMSIDDLLIFVRRVKGFSLAKRKMKGRVYYVIIYFNYKKGKTHSSHHIKMKKKREELTKLFTLLRKLRDIVRAISKIERYEATE